MNIVRESMLRNLKDSIDRSWNTTVMRIPTGWLKMEKEFLWFMSSGNGDTSGDFQLHVSDFDISPDLNPQKATTKTEHGKNVRLAINEIKGGRLKKVVISRIKRLPRKKSTSLVDVFTKLCDQHPHSFVYCYRSFYRGLWMGASPELLLFKKGNTYRTVSLAGTQPAVSGGKASSKKIVWNEKLLHEQKLVTDFITSALKKKGVKKISVSKTNEAKAGDMIHLKTEIEFHSSTDEKSLLKILHPTPAVCGLPRTKAKKFILENEQHERRLYTGYLGISNKKTREAIYFVNLRCMQVFDDHYELHLGGGITAQSNPQHEWEETELKATTLLNAINC